MITYRLGTILKDRLAGIISVSVLLCYPPIVSHSRHFGVDLVLTLFVISAVYSLILSKKFSNKRHAVLFGAITGCGLLVNQRFFIYLIGPILFEIICLLEERIVPLIKQKKWRESIYNLYPLISFFVISSLISIIFYIGLFSDKHSDYVYRWNLNEGEIYNEQSGFMEFMLFYFIGIHKYQLTLNLTIAFFISLPIFIKNRKQHIIKIILLWIITPILILSIFPCKYIRYSMPYLPALAIITGYGLSSINSRRLRIYLIGTFVSISIIQFILLSMPFKEFIGTENIVKKRILNILYFGAEKYYRPPVSFDNGLDEVLQYYINNQNKINKLVVLSDPENDFYLTLSNTLLSEKKIKYNLEDNTYLSKEGNPFDFKAISRGMDQEDYSYIISNIAYFDLIVIIIQREAEAWPQKSVLLKWIEINNDALLHVNQYLKLGKSDYQKFKDAKSKFRRIEKIKLSEDKLLYMYRKK